MTCCLRSQIADTCPLCQRLYAAHTLAHTLYVRNIAHVYVVCESPVRKQWMLTINREAIYRLVAV
jgi:hypothetical protein